MMATAAVILCMIGFPKVVDTTEELHLLCRDRLISDISRLQQHIV